MVDTLESFTKKQYYYSYEDHEGLKKDTSLEIVIPHEEDSVEELVTQVLNQMDPMMRYLDENISMF